LSMLVMVSKRARPSIVRPIARMYV